MSDDWQDVAAIQEQIAERVETLRVISDRLPEDLALIRAAAAGQSVDRAAVLRATASILDHLYRGVLSPRPSVPRAFWRSALGQAIARAHARVVPDEEVVSQAEAAQRLGVSREYVSQLVEAGRVRTIVRDAAAPRSRRQPREMLYEESLAFLRPRLRLQKERSQEAPGVPS